MSEKKAGRIAVAVAALALLAIPAYGQQFSDTYKFLKAVKDRDGTVATEMIQQPGSIVINAKDTQGNGALHVLARERDMTWLGFLLAKGAKADIQNKDGNTPLAIAAQIGWTEGVERLLRSGARVDLPNTRGETPLILAVHNRDITTVRLLLANGADPKRTDNVAGYSALDYARQDTRAAAILKLLEAQRPVSKGKMGPSL